MEKTIEELREERNKLYSDFYNNIIPERMPINLNINPRIAAEYGNVDTVEYQYDFTMLAEAMEKMAGLIYSDSCPFSGLGASSRQPVQRGLLDSHSFQMSQTGFMQHPEVVGMLDTEYDELTQDPLKCILEKIMPRQYGNLDWQNNPYRAFAALIMSDMSFAEENTQLMPAVEKVKENGGYYKGAPKGSGGFIAAPMDFLADQLRSFSGISIDIRRRKEQIKEACEALLPHMFNLGMPENPHPEGALSMPLHMPPFMRPKDVEELWFPTYTRLLEQLAARGVRVNAFCEADWTRFADMLSDLPAGTMLRFEHGDAKTIKEKLGNKMLLANLYPLQEIKSGTPESCIDKAKELCDIMLPGGGYLFGTDKQPLDLSDINLENYAALHNFLKEYCVYDNAGESFGQKLNSENFEIDENFGDYDSAVTEDLLAHLGIEQGSERLDDRLQTLKKKFDQRVMKMFV